MRATLSLAGRTQHPALPRIPHRIGGFGGPEGLAAWLREHRVTALVDATHPFASVMPWNAARAARATHTPLLALTRPAWQPSPGDRWTEMAGHEDAIAALGPAPRRIFLTVGRLELPAYACAPQHFYLARSIDPVQPKPLPHAAWLTARGPFTPEGERALLTEHAIEMLITKNSGGTATHAKLEAARALSLPVFLIRRPPRPEGESATTAQAALEWIARVHGASV